MYCNVLKYRIFTFIVKEQKKKKGKNKPFFEEINT